MPELQAPERTGRGKLWALFGLAGLAVFLAFAFSDGGPARLWPLRAEAASLPPPDWSFARPSFDALNAAVIQVCSAEATARAAKGTANEGIREAQAEVLVAEYQEGERSYNARVRAIVAAGGERPANVPSKALPLDLARSRNCLKVAVAAPRPKKAASPVAMTLVRDPSTGPVWVPAPEDRFITLEELDMYAAMAGWPNEPGYWPDMRKIILCESRSLDLMGHNTSDPNGGSWGLAQLNGSYHFERAGEDFAKRFDPVVNLRTALWLRNARGHYGGTGGWYNCAKLWGIE